MFLSAINFAVHHFRTSTGYDYTYLLIFAGIAILSYIVQANLKRKFEKYAKIPVAMTGHDVAVKMLHDNGIYDVKVTSTSGYLTDHYNPATKTVNLSQVYTTRQVLQQWLLRHTSADTRYSMPRHMHRSSCARHWYQWFLSHPAS